MSDPEFRRRPSSSSSSPSNAPSTTVSASVVASSTTSRVVHACPQCRKVFGKQVKLERHVQVHHSSTLSIPSDILTAATSSSLSLPTSQRPSHSSDAGGAPAAAACTQEETPLAVQTALVAALHEANLAFDAGNRACRRCSDKRTFASRKDLAAHIVAKHADADMRTDDGTVLASPSAGAPAAPSERSQTSPQKPAVGVKRPSQEVNAPSKTKRARMAEEADVTPEVKRTHVTDQADATPKVKRARASEEVNASPKAKRVRIAEDADASPKPKRTDNSDDTIQPQKKVLPSGTKPPVTPKKARPVIPPKAQALGTRASLPSPTNPSSSSPATAPVPNAPPQTPAQRQRKKPAVTILDFSAMAGIFTNSHKSYYRVVDP